MVFHLTMNDGSSAQALKENPMKREERDIAKWTVGNSYDMIDSEMILCNVKVNQKMSVRFVIIDIEYFILIEPEYTQG